MKKGEPKVVANVRVGKPDVDPSAPTHVRGIFQGHRPRAARPRGSDDEAKDRATAAARRSTGIRPSEHDTIDPSMPKLSPA